VTSRPGLPLLASALAREFHAVDRLSAFFDLVNQDPVASQLKLIAEPWDVGEGGYQVGGLLRCGRSGTVSTATPSATSGAASLPPSGSSRCASPCGCQKPCTLPLSWRFAADGGAA
jgi:hypothetical protein